MIVSEISQGERETEKERERQRERERESKRGHNLRLATCVLLDPVARSYRFARCLTLYSPMARHARVCTCTCTTTRRPTTTETQFNNSVSPARKWLAQLVRRVRVKFPRNFAQCDEPFDFRGHPFTGYLVSELEIYQRVRKGKDWLIKNNCGMIDNDRIIKFVLFVKNITSFALTVNFNISCCNFFPPFL